MTIDDDAVRGAVFLTNRYISGRFLPDKAIDVLDEAGSRARLSQTVVPPDLREIEKRIEGVISEKESSIQAQEFERAAAFRDGRRSSRRSSRTSSRTGPATAPRPPPRWPSG